MSVGGGALHSISRLGAGSRTSFVQVLQPNPCAPGLKENVTLEYSTEKGDHRGFMAVNARQYNLIGLRLEDFRQGAVVLLKMTVSCWNLSRSFRFVNKITTASMYVLKW